jgi:hypothetical protein
MPDSVTAPAVAADLRDLAAHVFARTGSVVHTSRKTGATTEQIENWLADQAFLDTIAIEHKHMEKATLFEIFRFAPDAMKTISRIARGRGKFDAKKQAVRLAAAKSVIDFWFRAQEFFALRKEIDEVKEQLNKQGINVTVDAPSVMSAE